MSAAVSDLEAIRRLTHEYSLYADTKQGERWARLFTEDGVLDFTSVGGVRIAGLEALLAYGEAMPTRNAHSFHLVGNHVVELDGDTAAGTCYLSAWTRSRDGVDRHSAGCYADAYVRTADGWRFRSRVYTALVP